MVIQLHGVKKNMFYSWWDSIDVIESDEFTIENATWRLRFYPKGKTNNGNFSLYLVLRNGDYIGINYTLFCCELGKNFHLAHTFQKADEFYGVDKLFPSSKLKSQDMLKIKCVIQETLIKIDEKSDTFVWTINGHLLQLFKSSITGNDEKKDTIEYHSPTFITSDGTIWQIDCVPCTNDGYFSIYLNPIQLSCDKSSIGINYCFHFNELNKTLRAADMIEMENKSVGFEKVCNSEEIINLDCLTITCTIQETMKKPSISTADIIWDISGDLLQQFKDCKCKDRFYSPVFCRNNGLWRIKIYPNGKTRIGCGSMHLWCRDIGSVIQDENDIKCEKEICVRYKMICPELGYKYYNDKNGSKMKIGTRVYNEYGFDFKNINNLNRMRIKCNIWNDAKSWELNVENMKYKSTSYIEFILHGLKWELTADRGVFKLDLIEFPAMISGVTINRRIVCNDINLCDENISVFCSEGYNENELIKYDANLLTNIEILNIICYIEMISLKPLFYDPPNISFETVIQKHEMFGANEIVQYNEEKNELDIRKYKAIFNEHNKILNDWKSVEIGEEISDEKSKENINNIYLNGLELYDEYIVKCQQVINKTDLRSKQASINGVKLGQIQRQLIQHTAQQKQNVIDTRKELDTVLNEYVSTRESRLQLQQLLENKLVECNQLINKENKLSVTNVDIQMKLLHVNDQMQEIRKTSKKCIELIDLYNEYIDENHRKIDAVKLDIQKQWNSFESQWMQWNCDDIIGWFKYNTEQQKNYIAKPYVIKWDIVKEKMIEQNIVGKTLNVMTENGLLTIQINDYEIRNHLFNSIQTLKSKYPLIKSNQNNYYENIPSKFKCKLSN
eukprot:385088_1